MRRCICALGTLSAAKGNESVSCLYARRLTDSLTRHAVFDVNVLCYHIGIYFLFFKMADIVNTIRDTDMYTFVLIKKNI